MLCWSSLFLISSIIFHLLVQSIKYKNEYMRRILSGTCARRRPQSNILLLSYLPQLYSLSERDPLTFHHIVFGPGVWTFTAGRPPYARAGYLTDNFRKLWPRCAFIPSDLHLVALSLQITIISQQIPSENSHL